jgi:Transposase DDE domain
MSTVSVGTSAPKGTTFSENFERVTFNAIRNVLPDEAILAACREENHVYRERKITPVLTVLHMLLAAIWPEESFQASWSVMWETCVSHCPWAQGSCPSRGSLADARRRLPTEVWQRLFTWVREQAEAASAAFDGWHGHRVVLADGTCVSMADQPELKEAFGVNTGRHGTGRYPLARVVTLCLAGTRVILNYALGRYDQGEVALTFPLLGSLRPGDVLLADRHFAGAHYYVRYQRHGLEFLTRIHQCLKIARIKRQCEYNSADFIGKLLVNKKYRRADPSLPTSLRVRFLQASLSIRGRRQKVWFATSLLDAERYPATELIALYAQRWRIETLLREVKIDLSADVLRSQTPPGIRKEMIARLVALNLVRTLILQAAQVGDIDPLRISFVETLRTVLSFSAALASAPLLELPELHHAMLAEIAGHVIPERPGRLEPRSLTRERKHYPTLRRQTRAQWRARHAA